MCPLSEAEQTRGSGYTASAWEHDWTSKDQKICADPTAYPRFAAIPYAVLGIDSVGVPESKLSVASGSELN